MAKLSEMFPSRYLKAADCDESDLVLTVREIKSEQVGQGKDAEDKYVLYFEETEKGLVLNKTNSNTIAKLHGDDTDDWEGKKIALYATEVEFQGQVSLGIRVRLQAPRAKGKAAKAEAAALIPAVGDDDDDEAGPPF